MKERQDWNIQNPDFYLLFCYCETSSPILREKQIMVSEKWVLGRILETETKDLSDGRGKLRNEKLRDL
jgi:hypothetical protein